MLNTNNKLYTFLMAIVLSISFFFSIYITDLFQNRVLSVNILIIMWGIHILCFYISDIFNPTKTYTISERIQKTFLYSVSYFLVTLIWFFFDKNVTFGPRSKIIIFIMVNAVAMLLTSWLLEKIQLRFLGIKRTKNAVLLVTTSEQLPQIYDRLSEENLVSRVISTILLVDIVDCQQLPSSFSKYSAKFICTKDLEATLVEDVIDETFIYLDSEFDLVTRSLLKIFEETGIDININISLIDTPTGLNMHKQIESFSDFYVIKYSSRFYNDTAVFIKRTIDIIGALVGLFFTVLVGIILVPLIKLDSPGPAIFAHNRVGKNGRIFKFYKFRSMQIDAEERKKDLMDKNEVDGLMFKMTDDPRITRVGKFIRKTSLDELPQFFNVLKGDMSLIGTRPPTEEEYRQYTRQQKKRLSSTPGITGLWQVSGRSDITNFEEVVKLDIEYIENWSLKLDFIIILKTIKMVFFGKGAK